MRNPAYGAQSGAWTEVGSAYKEVGAAGADEAGLGEETRSLTLTNDRPMASAKARPSAAAGTRRVENATRTA